MSRATLTASAILALSAACASYHRTTMGGETPSPATQRADSVAARADTTMTPSETALVGDWTFTGDLNQAPANGAWSMSYANGRWTGVVQMGSYPAAAIQGMSVKGESFQFAISNVNADWRFQCHLETPRTASCYVTTLNTSGRVLAYKR